MKILLTTLNSKFVHTNLALKYLKASLGSEETVLVNEFTINENLDDILFEILKEGYNIVAFSCYIWNIVEILKLSQNIKKIDPNILVILGGPEVSYDVLNLMSKNQFIDFVISGEGEISFKQLIVALKKKASYEEIPGLNYRKDNKIYSNPFEVIQDLSKVLSAYEKVSIEDIRNKIVYYETSRGCIYNCSYCLSSIDKGIRNFPLNRVKKELKKLVDMGAKQIKFVDRTFNYKQERTIDILNYLIKIDNGEINFHFEITAFILNNEIIEIFKSARRGLFQMEIGIQSTNSNTLKIVGRANKFEEICKWINEIKINNNVHTHLDLIAGLPEEDLESFKKSFNDTFAMQPDMLQLGFLKILKGTPMQSLVNKYDIVYRAEPPYEILKNNSLSYFEIMELKLIGEVVDRIYNNGKGIRLIKYLHENEYKDDPYKLFEELVNVICEKKIQKNIQNWEYESLFYLCETKSNRAFLKDLLRFEYIQKTKGASIPEFMNKKNEPLSKEVAYLLLREEELVNELKVEKLYFKEICKKIKWNYFYYDIISFIKEGRIAKKDNLIFTNFEIEDESNNIFISSRRYV